MAEEDQDTAPPAAEEADVAAMLDLSKKKKKKKKKTKEAKTTTSAAGGEKTKDTTTSTEKTGDAHQDAQLQLLQEMDEAQQVHPDPLDKKANYTYGELLDRIYNLIQTHNPDLVEKKRRNIKPPQLTLLSSKKTLWVNFQEICTMMQRDPQHVYQFFMAELGTEGSIDGNERLVIRGKYVPKYIESLLRKYVVEYVTCEMCRSPNTSLERDSHSRLYFLDCKDCGSRRSVAPIKSGYHATMRGDRRAARNAKG